MIKDKEMKESILKKMLKDFKIGGEDKKAPETKTVLVAKASADTPEEAKKIILDKLAKTEVPKVEEMEEESEEEELDEDFLEELPTALREALKKKLNK